MTLAAKVTYVGALLIGLSMGAWFGFDTATSTLESYHDARRLTAPTLFLEFSQLQVIECHCVYCFCEAV